MKLQKGIIKSSIYGAGALATVAMGQVARADDAGAANAQKGATSVSGGLAGNLTGSITIIINILIFIIGLVAVIMLIVGGFRYVFSQGNEKSVQGAKDTILYAIIGIVVAVLAFAIVNFILGGLNTGTPGGGQ